jgi:hypothetical protein
VAGLPEIVAVDWLHLPPVVWWVLALSTAIGPTAICFFLIQFASQHLPAAKVIAYDRAWINRHLRRWPRGWGRAMTDTVSVSAPLRGNTLQTGTMRFGLPTLAVHRVHLFRWRCHPPARDLRGYGARLSLAGHATGAVCWASPWQALGYAWSRGRSLAVPLVLLVVLAWVPDWRRRQGTKGFATSSAPARA